MDDLQIAYDLFVIMIGFAALLTAVLWAIKTGEAYLRDFCILYALFTLVLVNLVIRKYLLGIGYQIATLIYFASFTFAMLLGYGRLSCVWDTNRRNFVLGLLIFATVGYLESAASLLGSLQLTIASFSRRAASCSSLLRRSGPIYKTSTGRSMWTAATTCSPGSDPASKRPDS